MMKSKVRVLSRRIVAVGVATAVTCGAVAPAYAQSDSLASSESSSELSSVSVTSSEEGSEDNITLGNLLFFLASLGTIRTLIFNIFRV